jgi:hypothetical protein
VVRLVRSAVSPTGTADYPSLVSTASLPALAPRPAAVQLFALATEVDLAGVAAGDPDNAAGGVRC